jgi:hypothetical protein
MSPADAFPVEDTERGVCSLEGTGASLADGQTSVVLSLAFFSSIDLPSLLSIGEKGKLHLGFATSRTRRDREMRKGREGQYEKKK